MACKGDKPSVSGPLSQGTRDVDVKQSGKYLVSLESCARILDKALACLGGALSERFAGAFLLNRSRVN